MVFISGIVNLLLNSHCCQNLLKPSSQIISIPGPENLLDAKAPYLALILVGSLEKYVLKLYIYSLNKRKMY